MFSSPCDVSKQFQISKSKCQMNVKVQISKILAVEIIGFI